jgi:AcrR family transcriptional regulator
VFVSSTVFEVMTDEPLPPPPWLHRGKRPAPRRQLTQDAIVDAAIEVLDQEGMDAVSMRRVAQALGTGAASLYQHVGGKDELTLLMFDRIAGEVPPPPAPDPERWQEQVRETMTSVWRAMMAHPGIAAVAIGAIPSGQNALAYTEGVLAILRAGGLTKQQCAWAMDNLYKFVTADAYEQSLFVIDAKDEMHEELANYYRALPPARFPVLTDMLDELFSGDGDQRFAFGLDMLIAGLGAMAPGAEGA